MELDNYLILTNQKFIMRKKETFPSPYHFILSPYHSFYREVGSMSNHAISLYIPPNRELKIPYITKQSLKKEYKIYFSMLTNVYKIQIGKTEIKLKKQGIKALLDALE